MIHIAARDLFLNALAFCLLVLIIILPYINPTPTTAQDVPPPGNLIVSIAWPAGNQDVDLWVRAPGEEKAIGYSNKGGAVFNLLRDDLGTVGDTEPFNREDAYSRGLPDGEYVINVHCYRCTVSQAVTVEIGLATNGTTRQIVKVTVDLRPLQERTVARFRVKDGQVVGGVNNVFEPLRSAGK